MEDEKKRYKLLKKLYFKSDLKYCLLYVCLYLAVPCVYLKIRNTSVSDMIKTFGLHGFLIYSLICLALSALCEFVRCRKFLKLLRSLTPGELYKICESLDSCASFKLFWGTLYITDNALYYSGGVIVLYSEIEKIVIQRTESENVDPYHLYVYLHDGTKKMIPLGFKKPPESLKKAIHEKNKNIEITDFYKTVFKNGGKK